MPVQVPLTRGFVALLDEEDLDLVLAAGAWCASPRRNTVYALRATRRPDGRPTTMYLHRFLTGWERIDHMNGNGLDNRRANLRPATRAENGRNSRRRVDNTSGFKGVVFDKPRGKWRSRIRVDDGRIHLGMFTDPIAAARAYDAAALEHHGEFASLNFPQEDAA